jgi:hypothetical protein
MKKSRIVAGAILVAAVGHAAHADTPALTFAGGSGTVGHAGNSATTLGWAFEIDSNLSVTALGYYDDLGDGLAEVHDVGIFDASGTLLASATVPAGSLAALIDTVRYTGIAPLVLAPGRYTIGATIGATAADLALYLVNSPAFAPGIGAPAASSRYTEAGSYTALTYPDIQWPGANFYLGPDFEVATVPELPAGALMLAGLAGLAARQFRHRTR